MFLIICMVFGLFNHAVKACEQLHQWGMLTQLVHLLKAAGPVCGQSDPTNIHWLRPYVLCWLSLNYSPLYLHHRPLVISHLSHPGHPWLLQSTNLTGKVSMRNHIQTDGTQTVERTEMSTWGTENQPDVQVKEETHMFTSHRMWALLCSMICPRWWESNTDRA